MVKMAKAFLFGRQSVVLREHIIPAVPRSLHRTVCPAESAPRSGLTDMQTLVALCTNKHTHKHTHVRAQTRA